jgi:4-diphosphocytidyl-2-C-methyl-D-erythritol kinase
MDRPTFEARPPAKVNLTLEVLGRRPDGYHELRSTFLRIGLCDRLTMRPGSGPTDRLQVAGLPGTPVEGNLILRALAALRAHAAIDLPALDVTLEKYIPVAAGLGGGSSDAAAALKLAQAAWGIGLSSGDEATLAAGLGSDVPFFTADCGAARVEGRGEHVEPVDAPKQALLLVTPPLSLSTAAVFARYDDLGAGDDDANHLWPAAASLEPSIVALRRMLASLTSRDWLMSGSGPTLFALYPSVESAVEAGKSVASNQSSESAMAIIHAVDLVGPDPAWRYP